MSTWIVCVCVGSGLIIVFQRNVMLKGVRGGRVGVPQDD